MDYTLIPTDTEETQEGRSRRALGADFWRISWSFYAAIVGIIITTANLTLLNLRMSYSPRPSTPTTRRGSTFIGLNQLIRNESSVDWPRSRYSFPDYLGIIDTAIPEKIQPSSHRILLDSTHQTFAHFTVRDFGLQSCALSSFFPDQSHPDKQNSTNGPSGELDIWLLNNQDSARKFNWPYTRRDALLSLPIGFRPIVCNRMSDRKLHVGSPASEVVLGFWMLQSEVKT